MSASDARRTLLLAMAADVERVREQAARIKQLRREKERRDGRKISQETAAHEIGVSSRTYRTWEGVGATLQFQNLKALADYYGTTTSFIERGESVETPEPVAKGTVADLDRRLARIEAQLEELLGRRPPADIDGQTAEEAVDYLKRATQVMQDTLGQLGRDVGRQDLAASPAADRSRSRGQAAA